MSYGITTAGFVRKPQGVILAELEDQARALFGSDVDLSSFGEVGQAIQLHSQAINDLYETAEDIYYALFIDTASGVSLDRAVALGGMSREPAAKASVTVRVAGTSGSDVGVDFLVQTAQGIQFENIEAGTVGTGGTVDLVFRALEAGPEGVVAASGINEIVTPSIGIDSVINLLASSGGSSRETDPELRARYKARGVSGGSSLPAIIQALSNLENTTTVQVYENASNVEDGDGRPPHSIECVVGGTATDDEIAEAIFNSKAAGIETIGDEEATVLDSNGDAHTIKWNVPMEKFVNVIVEVASNSAWTAAMATTIKSRVVEVIGGVDTIDSEATEYEGLGIDRDVRSWAIIANLDGIDGIDTVVVKIAFSPTTPTASTTLALGASEVARCDTANVTVNVS
jgi:uncharacterized phage protein gp47/JayE